MQIRIEVDEETMAKWLLSHNNLKIVDESILYPEIVDVQHSDCAVFFTLEIPS